MKNPVTYQDLRTLILQQGISPKANIWPNAHFRKTMHYTYCDLFELSGLIRDRFNIKLTQAQVGDLGTISDTVELLNELKAAGMGATRKYEALFIKLEADEV